MINKITDNLDYDCCSRRYRNSILNTLLTLQPKYCCEIGSYLFQTSSVFSYYFLNHCVEGCLITLDVAEWSRGEPPANVYPLMVYPYINYIEDEHGGIQPYFKDYKKVVNKGLSPEFNAMILKTRMAELQIPQFDFIFVDGDHTEESFLNDLRMAKIFTKPEGYILIDDVKEEKYSQYKVYKELQRHNTFYEYDNFNPNPGMALIQNKEFTFDYM